MSQLLGTILEHPSECETSIATIAAFPSPPVSLDTGDKATENARRVSRPLPIPPTLPQSSAPLVVIATPQLELDEMDTSPFSESFSGIFEDSHILHPVDTITEKDERSFDVRRITDLKQLDPSWNDDEIDEVVILSPKPSVRNLGLASNPPGKACVSKTTPFLHTPGQEFLRMNLHLSDFEDVSTGRVSPAETKNKSFCAEIGRTVRFLGRSQSMDQNLLFTLKHHAHAFPGPKTDAKAEAWREKGILESLRNASGETPEFLERLYGSFVEQDSLYLLLGHYPRGTLRDYMAKYKVLSVAHLKIFSTELVSAVASLHSVGILHRAISPQTIFVDARGQLVLSHFEYGNLGLESSADALLGKASGAIRSYQAPELLLGWAHNFAVDYWGIGMTLYFMLTSKHPFLEDEYVDLDSAHVAPSADDKIMRGSAITEGPSTIGDEALTDLIAKCLERNPAIRDKVKPKAHRYFLGVNWHHMSQQRIRGPYQASHLSRSKESLQAPGISPRTMRTETGTAQRHVSVSGCHRPSASFGISTTASTVKPDGNMLIQQQISMADIVASSKRQIIPPVFRPTDPEDMQAGNKEGARALMVDDDFGNLPVVNVPMASFWDRLEAEAKRYEQAPPRPRKLRKSKSAGFGLSHRLSSFSLSGIASSGRAPKVPKESRYADTTSPMPTLALNTQQSSQSQLKLPQGVEQIGQGIGFTYSTPAAARSKLSLCTNTSFGGREQTCLFSSGLGLGVRTVKKKFSFPRLRSDASLGRRAKKWTDNDLEYTEDIFGASAVSLGLAMRLHPDAEPGVVHSIAAWGRDDFRSSPAELMTPDTLAVQDDYGETFTKGTEAISANRPSYDTPTLRLVTSPPPCDEGVSAVLL
ncbi:hypothetical protein HGRIS_002143 [Hohenbuehelia grisea]|uniref:Protein kinase domain-containing protein n=1 Tax=Hohenbuehelia grisea TaxID=104357 RepID=A0ABR3JLK3_9AGAR